MNEYEARKFAREDLAKAIRTHEQRLGRDPSYESCVRKANERADHCDKKKDRNLKD